MFFSSNFQVFNSSMNKNCKAYTEKIIMQKFTIYLTWLTTLFTLSFISTAYSAMPGDDIVQLNANFNDKATGSTLATGGATLGEPTMLFNLNTLIIEDTPGENFLRVENDGSSTDARRIQWEFENNQEITDGEVTFSFEFTPSAWDRYSFTFKEQGGNSRTFLDIRYGINGMFFGTDAAGNISLTNNSYVIGATQNINITFDMDTGTSQLFINDEEVFTGREHGIDDRGIGRFSIGYSNSSNNNSFDLDNLSVITTKPLPLILEADFEDKVLGNAIGTGGAQLGEPIFVDNQLITEIIARGSNNNQALLLQNSEISSSKIARWEFLNNDEITEGIIEIELNMFFEQLDNYQVLIREASASSSSFSNIIFTISGAILISDADSSTGVLGFYEDNQLHHLRMSFDLDNGIYTVWFDDAILVEDKPHGVMNGRGIGSILTGFLNNATIDASLTIDNLKVGIISDPDVIFCDGFD